MDKIPAQLIAKAKKYKVRECDEEIPGKFVAYVDLGDESFDVMIELDENGILKSKSCECNSKGLLCVHVAALILYQHKGKVVKKKAIRQKKRLPHDELLATIDHQQLQLWLSQMLATNKELQFHFMHEFGTKETVLTEEIIAGKMSDSIKAVLGKSKKMDASQVKKVLELWKPQHQKLITAFKEHPDDENTVKLMRAIFSEVSQTVHNYHIAGQKIAIYPSQIVSECLKHIAYLESEVVFNLSLSNILIYWVFCFSNTILFNDQLVAFKDILDVKKKKMFASKLTLYIRAIKSGYFSLNEFKVMVFNTLLEMNILENELEHFEPIQYNNQYNLLLIQKLIEYGQINKAEEFAEKQISNNVYPEYNVPYLSLLKKIYTQTGEENKKMEIIEKLLPLTYEKEDYLWLYEKLETEEDKKNWRSKIKIRSLNAMRNGNPYAMEFNFWLSFNDGKLKNMFDLLKYNSSLLFAIPYLKYLYELDSIQMLSALILSPCYFDFSEKYELEYQQIIEFVDKNYNSFQTSAVLKNIGRGHYDLRYNPIYSHLSKK